MYLNETEEILAIIVCVAIVIGFIFKTIQDVKSTIAEEKAKFNQQKKDEEKVRELIDFLDERTELLKNVHELQQENTTKDEQNTNPNDSINDLLKELELRLSEGQFKDSVHKIKFMVTKETVERLIHEN